VRLKPLACTGFSSTPGGLRLHYAVGGTTDGPNDRLAQIDVAESDDEVFVGVFESVTPGDKSLARVPQCVDISVELLHRVLRDGNAPRDDERHGARRYLEGAVVPRRSYVAVPVCHDWIGAAWEPRVGPQKWPSGTVHRRFRAPG